MGQDQVVQVLSSKHMAHRPTKFITYDITESYYAETGAQIRLNGLSTCTSYKPSNLQKPSSPPSRRPIFQAAIRIVLARPVVHVATASNNAPPLDE
jgi:hypothetical protein